MLEKESVERERLSKQNDTISEIGRIVSSTLQLQEVYGPFATEARKLIPFDRIVITTFNADKTVATDVLVEGDGEDSTGMQFPTEGDLRELATSSWDPLIFNSKSFASEILTKFASEQSKADIGLLSLMIVPLLSQGDIVGTIYFRSREENPYDQHSASIAAQIASQIAGAIAASRQYAELEQAHELLRTQAAVFEAAEESITIVRPDRSIEFVNDAFLEETGFKREEVIDQSVQLLRAPGRDATFDEIWAIVETGRRWSGIVDAVNKSGGVYPSECSITPVLNDDGEIVRFVGIRRNISDRIQAEEDRVARMRLDVENRELAELARQREEFFTSVSHELRTPLTSIMAFADILSRDRHGTLTDLQLEHLDVIKRNSRSLNELVEDMLDFSRLSTNRLKLDRTDVEIHSLVESVIESMEPTVLARDQQIGVIALSNPVWVQADAGRIIQVISNLVANSSKYSDPGSKIVVEVMAPEENLVSVKVTDQGVGIPEDELDEIFMPFFRSKREEVQIQPGTGLGLAISKTLVELHGGQISADSVQGEWTAVTLTLSTINPNNS